MTAQPSDKSPDQSPELRAALAARTKYATELQEVAELLGIPCAPFRQILEAVRDLQGANRDLTQQNAQLREELKTAKEVIAENDRVALERLGSPFDSPQFELRQRAERAEAALALHQKQIDADTANIEDMRAEEIRLRAALEEANAARERLNAECKGMVEEITDLWKEVEQKLGASESPDLSCAEELSIAIHAMFTEREALVGEVRQLRESEGRLAAEPAEAKGIYAEAQRAEDALVTMLKAVQAERDRYRSACENAERNIASLADPSNPRNGTVLAALAAIRAALAAKGKEPPTTQPNG